MKRIFTIIATVLLVAQVSAAPVGEQKAKEIAKEFMKQMAGENGQQSLNISFAESSVETAVETDEYYIFNNDNSFVVVSGDDRTIPVLGWSDEGRYDAANANPSVEKWLEYYRHEIQSLDGDVTPVKELTSMVEIAPIVPFKWDQTGPFNNMVPMDPKTEKRSLTGCPSVSLAQVLATMKYPAGKMLRSIPDQNVYTNENDQRVFKLHLDALEATSFKWDIMKPKYENTETGASADEVAKLMKYCGYALGTIYTSSLSTATSLSILNVSHLYFGYADTKIAYRSAYTKENWENLIYSELKAGYPVIHNASELNNGSVAGHSFIIDGYRNGYYHVNWGWGGNEDGYFMLSVLNSKYPEEKGANVTSGYSLYRNVIYNFRRPAAGVKISDSYAISLNKIGVKEGDAEYMDIIEVEPKGNKYTFDHTLELNHEIAPYVDRNYQLGWNIYSFDTKQFELESPVTDDGMKVKMLSGEMKKLDPLYTNIGTNQAEGDYALVWFYRDLDAENKDWFMVANGDDDFICIRIKDGRLQVFPNYDDMIRNSDIEVNNVRVEQYGKAVEVKDGVPQIRVYDTASMVYNVKNATRSNDRPIYLWTSDNDRDYFMTCGRGMDIDQNKNGEIEMLFKANKVGNLWVALNNEYGRQYNKEEEVKLTKVNVTGTSMTVVVSNVEAERTIFGDLQLTSDAIKGVATMTTAETLPCKQTLYVMLKQENDSGFYEADTNPDSPLNCKVEYEFTTSNEAKIDIDCPNLGNDKVYCIGIGRLVDGKIQEVDSFDETYATPSETAIVNVSADGSAKAAPVKVIRNGKLYIGNYTVAGQRVK